MPTGRRRYPGDPGPGSARRAPLVASASVHSLEDPTDASRAAPAPRDRRPRRRVLVAIRRCAPSRERRAGRREEESRDNALRHRRRHEPRRREEPAVELVHVDAAPHALRRGLRDDLARARCRHCRRRDPPSCPPNGVKGSVVEVGRAVDVLLGGGVIERCRQPGTGGSTSSIIVRRSAQRCCFNARRCLFSKMGGGRGFAGDNRGISCSLTGKLMHVSGEEAHITPVFVLSLI